MASGGRQAPSHTAPRHLVLFDGLCGLCDGMVRFLLRHDRGRVFRFAPIQSTTGRAIVRGAGGDPDLPSSFHVVTDFFPGSEDPGLRTHGAEDPGLRTHGAKGPGLRTHGSNDPGLRTHGAAQSRVLTKSHAVLFVADQLGWPWRAGVAFRIVPNFMRDWVYNLIARARFRLFGRLEQCAVPGPDVADRFVND